MKKKTIVLGASENPQRYSNMAVKRLKAGGHEVVAIGKRTGTINDVAIQATPVNEKEVDTVTLYLNALNQRQYEDYILSLNPKRIIFNPGAENSQLEARANERGIETIEACTLVLLNTNQY